ncbi:MAG TPA: glycoside hydrolase family 15 protein [Actinomycetota bacterium]
MTPDSLRVLRSGRRPSGAVLASPTFPVYRYSWLRDGAFIAEAFAASREREAAKAFHRWATGTVERYGHKVEALERGIPDAITDADVLHPRYTEEGEEVQDPLWSNFQLDGHGFWLAALARHVEAGIAKPREVLDAVGLTTRYLRLLWDRPCADCWEEHDGLIHPTTLCAVAAGLRAAAEILDDPEPAETGKAALARVRERGLTSGGSLAKHEGVEDVDASALLVLGPLGPFEPDDPIVGATLARIEADLVADCGGVHRYLDDGYYGGGLWVVLSGSLARVHALAGNTDRAREVLAWVEATADRDGALPEQVSTHLRKPEMLSVWEAKWGPVARPLLWSHAMHVLAWSALDQPEPPISS